MSEQITTIKGVVRRTTERIDTISDHASLLSTDITTIAQASKNNSESVSRMATAAMNMMNNTQGVRGNMEQVKASVSQVVGATHEMNSSFENVQQRCLTAKRETGDAMQQAIQSSHVMDSLSQSAKQIWNVIELIKSIAFQTQILSLNATIEAARAGEAGKPFKVVAGAVKDLAKRTTAATELITVEINSIQTRSDEATVSSNEIKDCIERLNQANNSIIAAIDEQTEITDGINRSMKDVLQAANTATDNVAELDDVAKDVAEAASVVDCSTRKITISAAEAGVRAVEVAGKSTDVSVFAFSILKAAEETEKSSMEVGETINKAFDTIKTMQGSVEGLGFLVDDVKRSTRALENSHSGLNSGDRFFNIHLVKENYLLWQQELHKIYYGYMDEVNAEYFKVIDHVLINTNQVNQTIDLDGHSLMAEVERHHQGLVAITRSMVTNQSRDQKVFDDDLISFNNDRIALFLLLDTIYQLVD